MTNIRMVCLAASARPGGFCYAGKDIDTERWVRPLTSEAHHAITAYDRVVGPGDPAKVGDVLSVPVGRSFPIGCQTENRLKTGRWSRLGTVSFVQARQCLDAPATLWENRLSTRNGHFDEMSEAVANGFDHSLLLIEVQDCALVGSDEGWGGAAKPRTRAGFTYNGVGYRLRATDPAFNLRVGERQDIGQALLCCSVAEAWAPGGQAERFVYKLVAGIITPERLG